MRKLNDVLEMIEYKVRQFAQDTAASIFYTSTKMETNIDAQFGYINYYFYDIPPNVIIEFICQNYIILFNKLAIIKTT